MPEPRRDRETEVQAAVDAGELTEEEAAQILSEPQFDLPLDVDGTVRFVPLGREL